MLQMNLVVLVSWHKDLVLNAWLGSSSLGKNAYGATAQHDDTASAPNLQHIIHAYHRNRELCRALANAWMA